MAHKEQFTHKLELYLVEINGDTLMNTLKRLSRENMVLIIILEIVIMVTLSAGMTLAKYTADDTVESSLDLQVTSEYTIDKSKLWSQLKALSNKPTTLKFVKGNDSSISALTSLTSDGIQDDTLNSNKIGVFQSADKNTVYIAPMAATGTSPANTDKVMYAPVDSKYLLCGEDSYTGLANYLKSLTCDNLDTSRTTEMRSMFWSLKSLTSIDISGFDTSKVTTMYSMFRLCESLETIDVSSLNTKNVIQMQNMFSYCHKLKSLDLSTFDTSNVTSMYSMFYDTDALSTLDISNFNTSNVTDLESMFQEAKSLTTLNLSNFKTSNVTDMSYMFYKCESLSSVNVSSFDTSKVTDMTRMFAGSQTVNADSTITHYPNQLTSLDISNFDTSKVKNFRGIFQECIYLTDLKLPNNFTATSATDMSYMFLNDSLLENIDLSSMATSSSLTTLEGIFSGCNKLKTVTFSDDFNTSGVTSMKRMFQYCNYITSLDLSSFDTSSVTTQANMFEDDNRLQEITLGAAFDFVGTDGCLPTPSTSYISGVDGKWYDTTTGSGYTPEGLATYHTSLNKERTYSVFPIYTGMLTFKSSR